MELKDKLEKYKVAKNKVDCLKEIIADFPYDGRVAQIVSEDAHQLIAPTVEGIERLVPLSKSLKRVLKMTLGTYLESSEKALGSLIVTLPTSTNKNYKYLYNILMSGKDSIVNQVLGQSPWHCTYEIVTDGSTLVTTDYEYALGELKARESEGVILRLWKDTVAFHVLQDNIDILTNEVEVVYITEAGEQQSDEQGSSRISEAAFFALTAHTIYTDSEVAKKYLTGFNATIKDLTDIADCTPDSYILRAV